MAKYWILYISIVLLALGGACCTDEDFAPGKGKLGDDICWVKMDFGHQDFDCIEISTRSTLDEVVESQVQDLYALIFVNDRCIYNHHFGSDSKESTQAAVEQASENGSGECWWVQNRTTENNTSNDNFTNDTHGTLCMNTPTFVNGELYLIANADAYTVNISPEKLGTIRTKQDLEELTSVLRGDVLTRYGYFPMVAKVEGITASRNGITKNNADVMAELERLDAKVKVNVMAATDAVSTYGSGIDAIQVKVNSFTPVSWQVMNVPKGSFILKNEGNQDDITGYFNSSVNTFEESTGTAHSFSFYMLENRHTSSGVTDYHQRDKRKKDANGAYLYPLPTDENEEKNIWQYAPENATYLILKGYLSMKPSRNDTGMHEIGADVTYYIHLGDFTSSSNQSTTGLNNFSVERNTYYTYNVTIKGVRNIELEVTEKKENQSGATGTIYATQEVVKQFDAHYEQFTTYLDAGSLNPNVMSWYVETPFGRVGSPKLNDNFIPGTDEYDHALLEYDYQWVWFMVNPKDDTNNVYDRRNQWYPGDQNRTGGKAGKNLGAEFHLMNVDEFVKYMKEQKDNYEAGRVHIFDKDGGVAVTIFVDEYYYQAHPITRTKQSDLWKQFVNQPNRMMHILSAGQKSADGESSITGGLITIRQKSIQTPYNVNKADLTTAWGCEVLDETAAENLWFYDEDNSHSPSTHSKGYQSTLGSQHAPAETTDNKSRDNGLYNTVLLMGLMKGDGYNGTNAWTKFLNYNQEADSPRKNYLNTGYKGMLYATLLRNRDNNGDGHLDACELKWYVASLGQIAGIFIGGLGFQDKSAVLYDQGLASLIGNAANGYPAWRSHIVTSTKTSYSVFEGSTPPGYTYGSGEIHRPAVVWAEEGLSTSYYLQENENWGLSDCAPFSIRCARNLGMDYTEEDNPSVIFVEATQPLKLVEVQRDGNVYSFDLSNVNEASLRSPSTVLELWPTHEFDFNSRTYKGFKTYSSSIALSTTSLNNEYNNLSDYLKGIAGTTTLYKTVEGYRVPNVREGALMSIYCDKDWWMNDKGKQTQTLVGTKIYRSYITDEKGESIISRVSWAFSNGFASLDTNGDWQAVVRPVQDYDPE